MEMLMAGQWQDRSKRMDLDNPFDGSVVDSVPEGARVGCRE